jgi:glycosyltransferase involved in cell wall biosynthesis
MRIGFVSTNDGVPWGGSEELWYRTAKLLKIQGVEIGASVAYWNPHPPHIQELLDLNIFFDFRGKPVEKPRKHPLIRARNKLGRVVQLRTSDSKSKGLDQKQGFIEKFKPDLMVISQGNLREGGHWKEACLKTSVPYVSVIQLVSEFHWFNDQIADELLNVYQKAQCNYFVSKKNLHLAERQLGCVLENAKIVKNPFKVAYDEEIKYPETQPLFQLACVSSLITIHKGQDVLFEVLSQDKWKSRPLKLNLYGKGPNEKVLKRLKEIWKLDLVEFRGFTHDVTSIWHHNHGLLMGSRMEGLPLALVEALLCNRIAIVPDVGGNVEVVKDNVTGFIAKSASFSDIDEALERAWSHRHQWESMGKRGKEMIIKFIPPEPAKTFAEELISIMN